MKKIDKNYYRNLLAELENESNEVPIVFTGRFKYREDKESKWKLFTTIRRFIPGTKTYTVCDHINIRSEVIEKYINLSKEYHNRKFYLVGRIYRYYHYNDLRWGIDLVESKELSPIWPTEKTRKKNIEIARTVIKSVISKKAA